MQDTRITVTIGAVCVLIVGLYVLEPLGATATPGLQTRQVPTDSNTIHNLAEQGNADAQYALGMMLLNGSGVTRDDLEAARWMRLAADQGHAPAQYNLGVIYNKGSGVSRDYAEAVLWYRLAADQGDAAAQHNLGVMYANGRGVAGDDVAAVRWFRLSLASRGTRVPRATWARCVAMAVACHKTMLRRFAGSVWQLTRS